MAQKFIILAVFAIACLHQIDAGWMASTEKAVFDNIITSLENGRDKIHERIETVKESLKFYVATAEAVLKDRTEHFDKLLQDINNVMKNDDVVSDECFKAFDDYRAGYDNVVKNTQTCVKTEVENGLQHVSKISEMAESVLQELDELSQEARDCRDAYKGFFHGIVGSVRCGTTLVTKSTVVKAKKVLPILSELSQASFYLVKLKPKIAYCASTEAYKNLGGLAKLSQLDYCL